MEVVRLIDMLLLLLMMMMMLVTMVMKMKIAAKIITTGRRRQTFTAKSTGDGGPVVLPKARPTPARDSLANLSPERPS